MILTFDIGATSVKTGIFDKNSNCFLNEKTYKTEHDTKNSKNLINKIVEDYLNDFNFKKIGIGFPGNIADNGEIIFSPNLPFLKHENIIKLINNYSSFSIKYENDANCAALGAKNLFPEFYDIVALTLGTGIGGGVILNGNLLKNRRSIGFELGHITVEKQGEKCSCGNFGCVEAYSSATGMLKRFNRIYNENLSSFEKLYKLTEKGDKRAEIIIREGFSFLGRACSVFANIFAPEIIFITGGIANIFKNFRNSFIHEFNINTVSFLKDNINFEIYVENNAGLIGAAHLFH
jgi:glucokinase